ncbi:30S ribosomal protein S9 [Candidatus Riflebacteria bacterium]
MIKNVYKGLGRRKTSIARVSLTPGKGQFVVNKTDLQKYFPSPVLQKIIQRPFSTTDTVAKFNVVVNVAGGGTSGQAGAVQLGIARALLKFNNEFRLPLRRHSLLTRDDRMKERKKPGLKRARKRPQFSKR